MECGGWSVLPVAEVRGKCLRTVFPREVEKQEHKASVSGVFSWSLRTGCQGAALLLGLLGFPNTSACSALDGSRGLGGGLPASWPEGKVSLVLPDASLAAWSSSPLLSLSFGEEGTEKQRVQETKPKIAAASAEKTKTKTKQTTQKTPNQNAQERKHIKSSLGESQSGAGGSSRERQPRRSRGTHARFCSSPQPARPPQSFADGAALPVQLPRPGGLKLGAGRLAGSVGRVCNS